MCVSSLDVRAQTQTLDKTYHYNNGLYNVSLKSKAHHSKKPSELSFFQILLSFFLILAFVSFFFFLEGKDLWLLGTWLLIYSSST